MQDVIEHKAFSNLISPTWRGIVDLRNIVAHEYFKVTHNEIFNILRYHLPIFEREFIDFVVAQKQKKELSFFLAATKTELKQAKRRDTVKYLTKVEKLLTR